MATTDVEILKEKNNFLAAYHALKFSKLEKDCVEAVDIERRCLAVKYFTARQSESEEMAASLLRRSLEDYQSLMEDRNGVNNYWKQIKLQTSKVDNDPQKWVSGLQNIETALDFLNPFSCQSDATLPCCKKLFNDKQIEKIINTWKNKETGIRNRKVSIQSNPSHSLMINKKAGIESNIQNKIDKPTYMAEESYSTNLNYNKPQLTRSLSLNEDYQNPSLSKTSKLIQKPLLPKLAKEEPFRSTRYNYEPPNINRSNSKMKAQTSAQCSDEECDSFKTRMNSFKTARDELNAQQLKANKQVQKKTLGGKQSVNSRFVCPFKRDKEKAMQAQESVCNNESETGGLVDERLRNVEPKMIELIKNEIMDSKTTISWNDIAGLEYAKKIIKEVVVYPMLRPDIFTGLRRPPKGILLFGPPGTGKTLIGKCIASQSKSTFFSISASSLTSKWIGEGEKMVRALFAVARVYQPSVIFVDEIDSLLTQRSETEHESSRRLKTEFLVQLDGAATAEDDRILIVGATNRPQELDEAARRRLVKRLYVPLPEFQARKQIICNLLVTVPHNLTEADIESIAEQSKGYSGADMSNLCKEASMGPIRSIPFSQLENIRKEDVRQVTVDDFKEALIHVRPSVSESSLTTYVEWDSIYGTGTAQNYKTQ